MKKFITLVILAAALPVMAGADCGKCPAGKGDKAKTEGKTCPAEKSGEKKAE
ncbi:MAG: hypothetical protein MUC91_06610 [Verrucomicrobia bacterium]|jgi:hypothetical protein|nr:hypothetical protein [Verrucomicrobiota bacterium]